MLLMFSRNVGVCDLNEAEVLSILKGLGLFSRSYVGALIVESDSFDAIAWVSNRKEYLWEFQFHLNEIMELSATVTCWRMC